VRKCGEREGKSNKHDYVHIDAHINLQHDLSKRSKPIIMQLMNNLFVVKISYQSTESITVSFNIFGSKNRNRETKYLVSTVKGDPKSKSSFEDNLGRFSNK
jgi:hypothetical protein